MKKIITLPLLFSACLLACGSARAAGFDITSNSTSAQTLASGTGTVESGKSLTVSGSKVAITLTGTSSIVNNGTISQTGSGRAIRDNTGGLTLTLTNNAGASITAADADVIQMNVANSNVTLNNYGSMISYNASLGGAQAVDFNAVTGTNTVNNYAGGLLKATAADAVRPGVNGTVNNWGTIQSVESGGSTGSDGIDAQSDSGIHITNYGTGQILGARHGITGGNTDGNGAYALTVTNNAGGLIQGANGSGINIDGINGNEVVTINNDGTITGNGATGDGDGVDVDGLVYLTNTGTIHSLDAQADTSEGVTVGGGTIVNSGLIEGSVKAGNTTGATGIGITIGGIDSNTPIDPMYGTTLIHNEAGGLIRGDTSYGIRVVGGASGFTLTITNDAGATIEGGGSVAAIQTGDDNDTVNDAGTIEADSSGLAVDLGGGTNALNITGGSARIIGDVAVHTGAVTIDPGAGNHFDYDYSIRSASTVEVKSGTVNLNHASTYAGATTVSGGTLLLHNTTGSGTGSGTVDVKGGAAFGGDGRIAFAGTSRLTVESGGTFIANGLAIDVSGITAGSTVAEFQAGATLTFTLSTETPALAITGDTANTVSFNGNTFDFTGSVANGTYVLIQGDNTTFSGLGTDGDGKVTSGATIDGAFAANHQGSAIYERDGNVVLVVTPEPGTWALLIGGVAVLGLAYGRRFARA